MLARRQILKQLNTLRRITTTKASTKMFSHIELHVKPELNLNKHLIYTLAENIVKPQAPKLISMQAEVLNENNLKLLQVQKNAANWKFENSNFHIIVPNNEILKIMPYPLKNVRLTGGNDNEPIQSCCNDPICPRVMLYNQRMQEKRLEVQAKEDAVKEKKKSNGIKEDAVNKEPKVKEDAVKEKKKSKGICSCFASNNSDYETKKKEPNIEQLEKEIQQMRKQMYELKTALVECPCIEKIQYDEYYTETADNVNTEARPLTLQDKQCQCGCIFESNQELCSATPSTTSAEKMIINDIKPSKTRKDKVEQSVSCESIDEQVEKLQYFTTPKRRSTQTQDKRSPMKSNSCLTMKTTPWTTAAQTRLVTKSDECMNFVCQLEEIDEEPNYSKVAKETANGREFKARRCDVNSNMKREILHRRKESLDKPCTSRKVARVSDASNDLEAIQQRGNTKAQQDAAKERDALTRKEIRDSLEMTRRNSLRKSGDIAPNCFEWKHLPNEPRRVDFGCAQQSQIDNYNNWNDEKFAQTGKNIGKSPSYVVKICKSKKNEEKQMTCCCGCCCSPTKPKCCCKPQNKSSSEGKPPRWYIQICKGCKKAQKNAACCSASSDEYYNSWKGKQRNGLQATPRNMTCTCKCSFPTSSRDNGSGAVPQIKASSSYVFKCFETDERFCKNNTYNKGMNNNCDFACFPAADSTPSFCEHKCDNGTDECQTRNDPSQFCFVLY